MGYSGTRYTQDFKDNAVAMYYEIRNAKKVADKLGVSHYAVQSWIKKANERKQPQATTSNQQHQPIAFEYGAGQ